MSLPTINKDYYYYYFQGMSSNVPGVAIKHSGQCRQKFHGMSSNIPGNVLKYSGECRQTFLGMSSNFTGNLLKHSGEFCQTFGRTSPNISGNVLKHSGECPQTFQGVSANILGNALKHSVGYKWCCKGQALKVNGRGLSLGCSFINLFHYLHLISQRLKNVPLLVKPYDTFCQITDIYIFNCSCSGWPNSIWDHNMRWFKPNSFRTILVFIYKNKLFWIFRNRFRTLWCRVVRKVIYKARALSCKFE